MNTLTRASFGAFCALALFAGASCSSGSSTKTASSSASSASSLTDDNTPLPGTAAVLVVNGLSCPKCANNIHLSLAQVPGVSDSTVDLASGRVTVQFDPLAKTHPSRATLARVVDDSGFTLVDVQSN